MKTSLPDCLTRMTEPAWASIIPQRSVLIIEREDGNIEYHAVGVRFRLSDTHPTREDFNAALIDRVERALVLMKQSGARRQTRPLLGDNRDGLDK